MKTTGWILLWILLLFLGTLTPLGAQPFTRADTLRGMLNPLRSCYDVTFYDLEVKLSPEMQRIAGSNTIHFQATQDFRQLQIDLFDNLKIARITYHGQELNFTREYNAVFVTFPDLVRKGTQDAFTVIYGGAPRTAVKPPWDGGIIWGEDKNGSPLLSVSCEGLGASSWWPLKDHLSDEPDSMRIALIVEEGLVAVSNGNLRGRTKLPGNFVRWEWFVSYPINSYNVTFYIGDYVQFFQEYENRGSKFRLDYFVLSYNEAKAKEHFMQVKGMLECFEAYFGPYPFPKDGFALVETNYWGMEHQSAIAYGNGYKNNEWGFDFIIIHESGHEWFGNSLSIKDHGELWIHEAFTTYAEMLFVECQDGKDKAVAYLMSQLPNIKNEAPILGPLNVNYGGWPDADMYYKGSWMLHSLRNTVNDDKQWFAALKAFAVENRLTSLDTRMVIDFFNKKLGQDYSYHFLQFLTHAELPVLEYRVKKKGKKKMSLTYRWDAAEAGFIMPVDIEVKGKRQRIFPTAEWQTLNDLKLGPNQLEFDQERFLYEVREME